MKSIVSYPDRGNDGNNSYRGNCSGKIIEDFCNQFGVKEISDYMCGSGTTEDVAKRLGIISHCYDLNRGFDLVNDDIKERNSYIFWHPPYGDMIKYAGEQYSAQDVITKYGFDPRERDLSRFSNWDEFVEVMNYCMMKQYASLEKGGRIAVLMGDMKKKGKLYSMLVDIVKPGTLENIVIKAQHNCWSDKVNYSGKFIPIVHEYLMICRKDSPLIVPIRMTVKTETDIRNLKSATWKDIVYEVMTGNGSMSLNEIYSRIEGHKRTQTNPHWKDKIRQTLQLYPQFFKSINRGVWEVCAA